MEYEDWLSNADELREQQESICTNRSKLLRVQCGIPQGSVLGPLLFILYINNKSEASNALKFILFADVTNLFCCGDNLEHFLDAVGNELKKSKSWFDSNKLTLNLNKTKFIIFGSCPANFIKKLVTNDVEIERVSEINFLGVMIDDKLCWKSHKLSDKYQSQFQFYVKLEIS